MILLRPLLGDRNGLGVVVQMRCRRQRCGIRRILQFGLHVVDLTDVYDQCGHSENDRQRDADNDCGSAPIADASVTKTAKDLSVPCSFNLS